MLFWGKLYLDSLEKKITCIDNSANLNHKNNISWKNKYCCYTTHTLFFTLL